MNTNIDTLAPSSNPLAASRRVLSAKASLLVLLALPLGAQATTYTFNGTIDSNWATAANWSATNGVAPTNNTFSARRININGPALVYSAAQGTTVYNNTTDRGFVIGTGSLTFTGGSFTSNNTNSPTVNEDVLGNVAGTSSLTVNGGAYSSTALTVNFGGLSSNTVSLNVQSGSATIGTLKVQGGTSSAVTINLDGGTFAVAALTSTGAGTKFNFNGGTFRTNAGITLSGFTNAFVKSGGAVFNTNGFNSTVSQALLTDAISTGGGLTKNGVGTLSLNAANTFTGATKVNVGTLALGASGSITPSAGVEIAAGAIFNTTAQSFSMSGGQTFTFDLDGAGSGSSGLFQAAALNIGSASVSFNVTGGALDDAAYILASYTSVSGTTFGSVNNLPAGYTLDYNYLGGNQIALVASTIPEPSTAAALVGAAGLLAALARRRRRS